MYPIEPRGKCSIMRTVDVQENPLLKSLML